MHLRANQSKKALQGQKAQEPVFEKDRNFKNSLHYVSASFTSAERDICLQLHALKFTCELRNIGVPQNLRGQQTIELINRQMMSVSQLVRYFGKLKQADLVISRQVLGGK